MFKSITFSLIILLSVVNGNTSISEKKKKPLVLVGSNTKQHGTGNVGKLKEKSPLSSSKNVEQEKKDPLVLVRSNTKQHGNGKLGKLKEKSPLHSSKNIQQEKKDPLVLVGSNTKQHGTGKIGNVEKRACSIDPKGPKLVILLSFGHSGANEVWNIMGKFTGENKYDKGFEQVKLGGWHILPKHVIEQVAAEGADGGAKQWLINYMCERQKENPDSYFVGFKWKPKMFSKTAKDVLEAIKSINVPIKVVRLHRNFLDKLISEEKAGIAKRLGLEPRCKRGVTGVQRCVYLHKELGTKMHLHTKSLIAKLDQRMKEEKLFDDNLKKMNIPHLDVHFHKLLDVNDMEEWLRILDFLGKPNKLVTTKDRNNSMRLESLSINDLQRSISNYGLVKDTLKNSKFDYLLY